MARGINKAIIVGVLGNDPEVRYTANGGAVANISVATNESWKDKTTGEKIERTEWHKIVFFNKLAEIVSMYLKKGSQVYVEGRIQTDKYPDKETGKDRYSTSIVAYEMQMMGSKPDNQQSAPQPRAAAPTSAPQAAPDDDFDSIPF